MNVVVECTLCKSIKNGGKGRRSIVTIIDDMKKKKKALKMNFTVKY